MQFNEYLTSNVETAYPFKDDAAGLALSGQTPSHGIDPLLPLDFFLDIVVLTPQPEGGVYLKSIARSGTDYTFVFTDETETVILNNVKDLSTMPAEREIITFETATVDTNDSVRIRAVVGGGFEDFLTGLPDASTDDFVLTLPVSDAAVEHTPPQVSAIRINDSTYGIVDITGEVQLIEGYNCGLTAGVNILAPGGRDISPLTITLAPGLGAGAYNNCEDEGPIEYLARINGLRADEDGNFFIEAGECHNIIADAANNRLILSNECVPCCECQDYANVVAAEKNQLDDLKNINTQITDAVESLNNMITSFNVNIKTAKKLELSFGGFRGQSEDPRHYSASSCMLVVGLKNWLPIDIDVDFSMSVSPDDFEGIVGWISYQETTTYLTASDVEAIISGGYTLPTLKRLTMMRFAVGLRRPYPGIAEGSAVLTASYSSLSGQASVELEGTW